MTHAAAWDVLVAWTNDGCRYMVVYAAVACHSGVRVQPLTDQRNGCWFSIALTGSFAVSRWRCRAMVWRCFLYAMRAQQRSASQCRA